MNNDPRFVTVRCSDLEDLRRSLKRSRLMCEVAFRRWEAYYIKNLEASNSEHSEFALVRDELLECNDE